MIFLHFSDYLRLKRILNISPILHCHLIDNVDIVRYKKTGNLILAFILNDVLTKQNRIYENYLLEYNTVLEVKCVCQLSLG